MNNCSKKITIKKNPLKKKFSPGFSLIELMVVIIIVGLLATFAIPAYDRYVKKTELTNLYNYANSLKIASFEYALTRGSFENLSADNLGVGSQTKLASANIASFNIELSNSNKQANLVFEAAQDLGLEFGAKIILKGTYETGNINWECLAQKIDANILPSSCTVE